MGGGGKVFCKFSALYRDGARAIFHTYLLALSI